MNKKTVVIGCGAAGMLFAVMAAENGADVTVLEKNDKPGKKLFITGKGRCNLTNACDTEELFHNVVSNEKFMYSSFYSFDNFTTMQFFEKLGLKLKTERGNRVFPESDHSSDVIAALQKEMKRLGVKVRLNTAVTGLILGEDKTVKGVCIGKERFEADVVVLATGGNSYPLTGSTGDGYGFAKEAGHTITALYPALVPMICREEYVKQLQGLSLRNIKVSFTDSRREYYSDFGEMLFTHYGVSGPVILSASSILAKQLKKSELTLHIDLKPALTKEQLDKRILREFDTNMNKQFKNILPSLFPSKLIPVMVELCGIDADKKIHEITKEERKVFTELIKDFKMTVTGLRGFEEAIITQGGVNVKEINPSTMESKLVKGLYVIGELLDVDALTGGFNLQIAWSTAALAAQSLKENME